MKSFEDDFNGNTAPDQYVDELRFAVSQEAVEALKIEQESTHSGSED